MILTSLGTVLGVGAFVATVGLTATAGGQISERFDALLATEVVAAPNRDPDQRLAQSQIFPADSDERVSMINGVVAGGVFWSISDSVRLQVAGALSPTNSLSDTPVYGASPGLLRAVRADVTVGRLFGSFHAERASRVAVLGSVAATELGVVSLAENPAVFIDGIPFTVVGIIGDVERQSDLLFGAIVPRQTAEAIWGNDESGSLRMVIETDVGAAQVVADQLAVALRPDQPELISVTPPPNPSSLRDQVANDFGTLFVLLAGTGLAIGGIGIANTTLVSILERTNEIGLRRALGATRRNVALQFVLESTSIGLIGGIIGTSLGVMAVVLVAFVRDWTPILDPRLVLATPFIGMGIGAIAGLYPSVRASRVQPIQALRR